MGPTVGFILLITLSGVVSQTPVAPVGNMFNCFREGISCADGNCDTASGTSCTCQANFNNLLDYHCVASDVVSTTCANPANCLNGAECRLVNGQDTCFCSQMYTGATCNTPRIEVICCSDTLTVVIRPHGTFAGAMYAKTMADNSSCTLTESSEFPGEYGIDFAYNTSDDTNCGIVQSDLVDADNNIMGVIYEIYVIIQYTITPNILTGVDQEFRATCKFRNESSVSGIIIQTDVTSNLESVTGEGEGSPLELSIFGEDSTTALAEGATVNVGSPLTIDILLQNNPVFPAFMVDECTASNMMDEQSADHVGFQFVKPGGCPANNAIVRGSVQTETPTDGAGLGRWRLEIFSFMFVSGEKQSSTLYVKCKTILCAAAGSAACQAQDCTGGSGARKRRSADTETRVVGQTLTVRLGNSTLVENESPVTPGSGSEQLGKADTATATCLNNPVLQTVVSLLAIFLIAALIALAIMASLYCRRSKRHEKDDVTTPSTSALHMHFPLPRPRV